MSQRVYKRLKKQADVFLPEQLSILKTCFCVRADDVRVAGREDDIHRNTDAFVSVGDIDLRISLRVLSAKALGWGSDRFTLRTYKPSGNKTELAKITEGWGDYMLSCFGDSSTGRILHWKLLNLYHFREEFDPRWIDNGSVIEYTNRTDGSKFISLSTKMFSDRVLVSQSVLRRRA